MTDRGFFAIGVFHSKSDVNIGTLMRSAEAFGASFTFTVGRRGAWKQASNNRKAHRHVPHFEFDTIADLRDHLPVGCLLVGVELMEVAIELPEFSHPERACYLMGAEDHGLSNEAKAACHIFTQIPGAGSCLNVAVAGSIVMYDRVQRGS